MASRLPSKDIGQNDPYWRYAAKGLDRLIEGLKHVEGLISLHAQYASPIATVVAFVECEDATRTLRAVEDRLFDEDPYLPIELHVELIAGAEIDEAMKAVSSAFGLLWARATPKS